MKWMNSPMREEEANNVMEDNPSVRHGNGFWGRRDEETVRE